MVDHINPAPSSPNPNLPPIPGYHTAREAQYGRRVKELEDEIRLVRVDLEKAVRFPYEYDCPHDIKDSVMMRRGWRIQSTEIGGIKSRRVRNVRRNSRLEVAAVEKIKLSLSLENGLTKSLKLKSLQRLRHS